MHELRFKPRAAWRLDDNTPFDDYSGYGFSATRAGTEIKALPLTSVATYGQVFDATHAGNFTIPDIANQKSGNMPFSITFTAFYIPDGSGNSAFIKRNDNGSVITFSGTTLTCTLSYSTGPTVTATADFQENQRLDVAIIYNRGTLEVYINDALAASEIVPNLAMKDTFLSTDNRYNVTANGTSRLVLNNLCFFQRGLARDSVKAIYDYNNRSVPENVAQSFGGMVVPFAIDNYKPVYEVVWDTETEWKQGLFVDSVTENDIVKATLDSNLVTVPTSYWIGSMTFELPGTDTFSNFESCYFWWEGLNETVSVSNDGVTWNPINKGGNLATSFNPNGISIFVKVNFTAGKEEAYLNWIKFRAFSGTSAQQGADARIVNYAGNMGVYDTQVPKRMKTDWGIYTGAGASITINPVVGGETIKTLELWVKPTTTTIDTNRTGTSTYVNGVLSGTPIVGAWNLVHIVSTTGWTTATVLGQNQQVGQVAYYTNALTASDVTAITQAYTGFPTFRANNGSGLVLSEPTTPATIYTHDWLTMAPVG